MSRVTIIVQLVVTLCLFGVVRAAHGVSYGPRIDEAQWQLDRSPLLCRLYQPLPFFGAAEFSQPAGEASLFRLQSSHTVAEGTAQVRIDAPPWLHQEAPGLLAAVPVFASRAPVLLDAIMSEQLLTALYKGLMPVFAGLPWQAGASTIDVALSSANFQRAYHDYRECVSELIPATFAELERSRLKFAVNQWRIAGQDQTQLNTIIRYIQADSFVTGIFVDGYTDDQGRRSNNRELSKRRAESVTRYLVAHGVPEDKITTRHHGESFPSRKGRDPQSRAENRRVTVRLERF